MRSANLRWSAALLLSATMSAHAGAAEQVTVLGLFKDKAVVLVDGKRRVLGAGETSPEGITLVSADSEEAILEIDGELGNYPLGTRITTNYASHGRDDAGITARIWRSPNGMYNTPGSINGYPVDFVVDTGATLIAMNKNVAKRIGIDYLVTGRPSRSETANGVVDTYIVRLDEVQIGDIALRGVWGAVLDSEHPRQVLLGMSALNRLEVRRDGNLMELTKKY
ncbi:MAG: TIGR02281 family clan AA aspartic protease [Gammaproteobacteria bacterium]|nr:TIGR02281 family clan AA aspartic protease [Gammaproteobacteria bacterium]NIR82494.1 TIGR02281 family clan AA aspartic protease [Gammaproteobacteria bacterium]NIR88490.1 TIGR02281 family clan AA aspartic protease [Gammaproteobacteria bacterium]NIU03630.1 TIGR02281 family clan AA aspartic protease [Gammaproteobacteria bacterium]NIV50982.1 TIGR02281 family clan AA aspartic protease [Gammaproteobacteria bacterium]